MTYQTSNLFIYFLTFIGFYIFYEIYHDFYMQNSAIKCNIHSIYIFCSFTSFYYMTIIYHVQNINSPSSASELVLNVF